MITVLPVASRRHLRAFLRLPQAIYRDDPAWVSPLLLERRLALSAREPVFDHLQWQAWLAWRNGRPVGRISAQIDQLHQRRYADDTGFFGLIEGEDDAAVFEALFGAAEAWLRARGMERARGPLNLNMNQEVGLLHAGYETPPSFMMGHARPWYHPRIEAQGYRPCQELLAYEVDTTKPETRASKKIRARISGKLRLRHLNRRRKGEELDLLRTLFNEAWSGNWGFVPFTKREFDALGKLLLLAVPDELICIAELDGEACGFIVAVPNLNEAIVDLNGRLLPLGWLKLLARLKIRFPTSVRVPLMGIVGRLQNTATGAGVVLSLIDSIRQAIIPLRVQRGELSWILRDNTGMRRILEHVGSQISKRYLVYQKGLGE